MYPVTWIFLMKHKYKVCQIFVDFFHFAKNQFGKSIKRLRLDNDTEFVNLEFSKFFLKIMEEVVLTATYLINRFPTRVLNNISSIKHMLYFFPNSLLMLSLPSHVFGCVAFVHSYNPHRGKLDFKAVKYIFIGYPSKKKWFKCYHPPSRQIFISMDVTFHETQSLFVSPPLQESYLEVEFVIVSLPFLTQDAIESLLVPTQDVMTLPVPTQDVIESCLSSSSKSLGTHSSPKASSIGNDHGSSILFLNLCVLTISMYNIGVLLLSLMQSKHLHQYRNNERRVERPKDKRVVGCRWIYTVKCKSDGSLEQYKERLVTKGYTQTYGIDYDETFVPVSKMNTVRVILSLVAHFSWNFQQFDIV
ncbi:hypothetical protein CR513_25678, partial [Mucuna pruriens]